MQCKEGTTFNKYNEASANVYTSEYIFNLVENCIKEIRKNRVLQIVTLNHPSNMAMKNMLKESLTYFGSVVQPTQ